MLNERFTSGSAASMAASYEPGPGVAAAAALKIPADQSREPHLASKHRKHAARVMQALQKRGMREATPLSFVPNRASFEPKFSADEPMRSLSCAEL
eukprot:6186213-Pleurochrysis_carterae.AAC.3